MTKLEHKQTNHGQIINSIIIIIIGLRTIYKLKCFKIED